MTPADFLDLVQALNERLSELSVPAHSAGWQLEDVVGTDKAAAGGAGDKVRERSNFGSERRILECKAD